jgi:putative CocE/NonD family hydrolase
MKEIGPAPLDPRAMPHAVQMRDGVQLATDVYLPETEQAHLPTVLVRLPYDKCGRYTFIPAVSDYLNAHGFAVVVQDVRGKFRSAGDRMPFVNEALDGYDTLDWIVSQPWCSEAVGMLGDSYYGYTQWAAAASGHRALRAIVPRVTGSRFMEMFGSSHVPKIPLYEWALHTFAVAGALDGQVLAAQPLSGLADVAIEADHMPEVVEQVVKWCDDGTLSTRAFPSGEPATSITIPALHMGGWWDNLQRAQLDDWHAALASPAAGHQFLRMTATDHEDFQLRAPGEPHRNHEVDDDALSLYLPRMLDEAISFLRHYLTNTPGRWPAARVRYQIAHSAADISDAWPPRNVTKTVLHLDQADQSVLSVDGGTLTQERPAGETVGSWIHDPTDPVPFLPASEWSLLADLPDESGLHIRRDVATFTTCHQARPVDIIGPVELEVVVAAESTTTHVIARLLDVDPSGPSTMILEGAASAETRNGPTSVIIRLGDTAYRLRRGHRLRIAVSSSCFPLYMVHPGTDDSPLKPISWRPTRQCLHAGSRDPAHLRLMVRGDLGGSAADQASNSAHD